MSYPTFQLSEVYLYWNDTASFLLQSNLPTTAYSIRIFKKSDGVTVHTLSGTTDANGDALGSLFLDPNNFGAIDTYIARATINSVDYDVKFFISRISLDIDLLKSVLASLMKLPREELGRLSIALQEVQWGYRSWSFDPAPSIVTNERTDCTGAIIKLDYGLGKGVLVRQAEGGDEFLANYNFAYLDEETLYSFLRLTLQEVNAKPPRTSFDLENMPSAWEAPLILGAYIKALKKLLLDLGTFQWKRVFEDPTGMATQASAMLAAATAEYTALLGYIKRRSLLIPAVIRGYDATRLPNIADQTNWRAYTLLG